MQAMVMRSANLEAEPRTVYSRYIGTINWCKPDDIGLKCYISDHVSIDALIPIRRSHDATTGFKIGANARHTGRTEIDHAACLPFVSDQPDLVSSNATPVSKVQAEGITA